MHPSECVNYLIYGLTTAATIYYFTYQNSWGDGDAHSLSTKNITDGMIQVQMSGFCL